MEDNVVQSEEGIRKITILEGLLENPLNLITENAGAFLEYGVEQLIREIPENLRKKYTDSFNKKYLLNL